MKRFARWLSRTVAPFSVIAKELTLIRQLKELELAHRVVDPKHIPAPLYPLTESPSPADTEVFYGPEDKRTMAQKLAEEWERESED